MTGANIYLMEANMAKDKSNAARPERPAPEKANRPGRKAHPSVGNKDTNVYPFKELPGDFDFATMKGLKKKDFATDAAYYEYRAKELEARAAKFRTQAEEAKKMGTSAERKNAKRLVKLREKMDELKAQLAAQGVDVESLLNTLKKDE